MSERRIEPLTDPMNLAWEMMAGFAAVAPAVGVRLEGLPDDANEHARFWQRVAAHILNTKPPTDD